MPYDSQKYHRHSIRLQGYDYSQAGAYFITICTWQRECLFGEIVNGEMQLSRWGEIVRLHWQNLPKHHRHLELDEFVVMPNHLHGIIVIIEPNPVGAGLADTSGEKQITYQQNPPNLISQKRKNLAEIIRGFKTFSARRINQMRRTPGIPVWQRNYYEHIIRNEESLQQIRQYVINNVATWELDQIHPNHSSKW